MKVGLQVVQIIMKSSFVSHAMKLWKRVFQQRLRKDDSLSQLYAGIHGSSLHSLRIGGDIKREEKRFT